MPISRRQLLAAAGLMLAVPRRAFARERGALVIVRRGDGVVAVDPCTGAREPWDGPPPATPAPVNATASPMPDPVAVAVTEGTVGYGMAAPSRDAFIFRLDTGVSSSWWWVRGGGRAVPLDLPGDLEPAFQSGTSARWFHGATVEPAHLGAGTLRLIAVDIATGEIALDHDLDRRLELAATAVSDDGALVAHAQSSTTGLALWAADLREGARQVETVVESRPGLAAASAIDLAVVADGDAVLVVAGITWDWPGAPGPMVYIMHARWPESVHIVRVPGVLIGIISENDP